MVIPMSMSPPSREMSSLARISISAMRKGGAGAPAERLAHEPRLQSHERVAHLALDLFTRHERRDRVDDDDVDGARPDERVGDLKRLLAVVGLRDEQIVGADPAGAGPPRV